MTREFIAEADIAIRPPAQMKAIDPHVAIGHHSIKIYKDATALVTCGKNKMLAIPAHPRRQETTRSAARIVLVKGTFNDPVVWHVESSPLTVIEAGLFGVCGITQTKLPALVHRNLLACLT